MMRKRVACLTVLLLIAAQGRAVADEPAQPLDQAPSRFAKLDDLRIHYKSLGEGTTALVFVHGWSCNLNFWKAQVPAFIGKTRLILIDLPGHGQSDKPKIDYTMDLFAKAVHAVLMDAKVESAVLAGHSMGTPVIRQFYRLYPEMTRGLIAVDGPLKSVFPPELLEGFLAMFSGPDFLKIVEKFVDQMFSAATSDELRKTIKTSMLNTPQHVAVSAMRGMGDPAIWKDDDIKVPLQAITAKSPHFTAEYQQYVHKLAPHVDYQIMDGVGHFLMMEKPEAFNHRMMGFLKKNGFVKP